MFRDKLKNKLSYPSLNERRIKLFCTVRSLELSGSNRRAIKNPLQEHK